MANLTLHSVFIVFARGSFLFLFQIDEGIFFKFDEEVFCLIKKEWRASQLAIHKNHII